MQFQKVRSSTTFHYVMCSIFMQKNWLYVTFFYTTHIIQGNWSLRSGDKKVLGIPHRKFFLMHYCTVDFSLKFNVASWPNYGLKFWYLVRQRRKNNEAYFLEIVMSILLCNYIIVLVFSYSWKKYVVMWKHCF